MKFSIVLPIYNGAKYLKNCIASVRAQNITDWEVLAVDDGSIDESWKILNSYAKEDKRIRVFRQKNRGQFWARQTGIKAAAGDYVLFLDCDDELEPECLAVLDSALKKKDIDILLYTGSIYENGMHTERCIGRIAEKEKEIPATWIKRELISSNKLNSLWLKAFRRELFEGDSMDYSCFEGVHYGEDKVRLLYPVTAAKCIRYIPDSLYRYYHHEESIMRRLDMDTASGMIANEMFAILRQYMQKWNMTGREYQETVSEYYIRNYLSVYFNLRKSCVTKEDRKAFRKYPWIRMLDKRAVCYGMSCHVSMKEKIKLLTVILHL